MNKTIGGQKKSVKDKVINRWKGKNEAYLKTGEQIAQKFQGQTRCATCRQDLKEIDAMNGPDGQLIHEACYEPGDNGNY